ncbi:uncharacterized protein Bfra_008690 [Botrytis fragariae]|uniref:Uncharacterized protein n=1 Tax=Botrytis fragariae TaxID=1964551 RepID=A0A8H6EGQ5_9HELO|nr:uncharacterized protein Bfra_008690 [Botrytis fragariae]KAF5871667.1 hypothetical protein Bfra_008690 [Botrytis fragariae]
MSRKALGWRVSSHLSLLLFGKEVSHSNPIWNYSLIYQNQNNPKFALKRRYPWLQYHGQDCLGVTVHAYSIGSVGTYPSCRNPWMLPCEPRKATVAMASFLFKYCRIAKKWAGTVYLGRSAVILIGCGGDLNRIIYDISKEQYNDDWISNF